MMTGCGASESMCKVSFEKDPFPSFKLLLLFIHATLLSPQLTIDLSRLSSKTSVPLLFISNDRRLGFSKRNSNCHCGPHTISSSSFCTIRYHLDRTIIFNYSSNEDISVICRLSWLLSSHRCLGLFSAVPQPICEACYVHGYHITTHRSCHSAAPHYSTSPEKEQSTRRHTQVLAKNNEWSRRFLADIYSGKEHR